MKIYREVLIASAEQAEALPGGTVALRSWGHGATARTLNGGSWITPSGAALPHAELVGFAALVPIEAAAADIWDQGWDVGRRFQGPNSNPYRVSGTASTQMNF